MADQWTAARVGRRTAIHAIGPHHATACGLPADRTTHHSPWRPGRGCCAACIHRLNELARPVRPPLVPWEQTCGDTLHDEDGDPTDTCFLVAGHPGHHTDGAPNYWPNDLPEAPDPGT